GQLSVGADGTVHDGPQERLIAEHNETKSRLAQNSLSSFYKSVVNHNEKKAFMTIVDDDARNEVYTLLKQIVERQNVPITISLITGSVDVDDSHLNLTQINEMISLGFEFVSHTHTQPNLTEITPEEVEYELKTSRDWLLRNG